MTPPGIFAAEHGPADAPLVVLIHGAPDRSTSFAKVLRLLPDLRVLTYDRRGYGESIDARPLAQRMSEHSDDLLALLDGRSATLVGHSYGANVAMLTASRVPEQIRSLGLWEPPAPWMAWWPEEALRALRAIISAPDTDEAITAVMARMVGSAKWDRLSESVRARRRAEGHAFRLDVGAELVAPFDYTDVNVPATLGFGTASWSHAIIGARTIGELIGAALLEVEGADHFVHTRRPEVFAGLVDHAVARAW